MRVGGEFFLDVAKIDGSSRTSILLLAGGVGINPLASMIFEINKILDLRNDANIKVGLLYSAKSEDELIFKVRLFDWY